MLSAHFLARVHAQIVQQIDLDGNKLTELNPEVFSSLTQLQELLLLFCRILSQNCHNLKCPRRSPTLWLNNNAFTELPEGILNNKPALSALFASDKELMHARTRTHALPATSSTPMQPPQQQLPDKSKFRRLFQTPESGVPLFPTRLSIFLIHTLFWFHTSDASHDISMGTSSAASRQTYSRITSACPS